MSASRHRLPGGFSTPEETGMNEEEGTDCGDFSSAGL